MNRELIEVLRAGPAAAEIDRLVEQGIGESDLLATITSLRKQNAPEVAAGIAETALLRLRASAKFAARAASAMFSGFPCRRLFTMISETASAIDSPRAEKPRA